MADDLYSVLGVAKTAKTGDITKAYRKLARELACQSAAYGSVAEM